MAHNLLIIGIYLSIHPFHFGDLQSTSFVQKHTILCFGNSITAGYNMDPIYAYPAILEVKLKDKGYDVQVINAGLSGETSAGGLERINWILRQPIDVFILELGGNDGLRGLPLDQTKQNLQSIIDQVKAKYPEVKIVIAGMMVPPNMGERYGNAFVKIFPELAWKNNTTLIPFLLEGVGGDPALNMPDGIHPNVEGHKIVAENVMEAILPLLKK
jgi:acyl-CoA thioesterase-1